MVAVIPYYISGQNDNIVILGTTSAPWQLDAAVGRRFEKRIHIPMPEMNARAQIFRQQLVDSSTTLASNDYIELGALTEGYYRTAMHGYIFVISNKMNLLVSCVFDSIYRQSHFLLDVHVRTFYHSCAKFKRCLCGEYSKLLTLKRHVLANGLYLNRHINHPVVQNTASNQ